MKEVIKRLLRCLGWELHRINPHSISSMNEGLQWLRRNGFTFGTVLDVGASDGRWSAQCMEVFPDANYVLFEPQHVHSDALDRFAKKHGEKVVLIKQAVGQSEGRTFFSASSPFGGSLANETDEHAIEVELTSLDSNQLRHKLNAPFLLKLDTHGYEKSILSGASKTLEQCEALIIEAYNFRISDEALLFWELCSFLSDKGFRPIGLVDVLQRKYDGALWQMDIFFIRSSWSGFDHVAYE